MILSDRKVGIVTTLKDGEVQVGTITLTLIDGEANVREDVRLIIREVVQISIEKTLWEEVEVKTMWEGTISLIQEQETQEEEEQEGDINEVMKGVMAGIEM